MIIRYYNKFLIYNLLHNRASCIILVLTKIKTKVEQNGRLRATLFRWKIWGNL
jgi:hypothetical protein